MLSINKAIYVEDTFCYRDYVCQLSKLQHMYVIGLILLSVLETMTLALSNETIKRGYDFMFMSCHVLYQI